MSAVCSSVHRFIDRVLVSDEMWGIGIDTAPGLANNDYMTLYAFTAKALKSVSPRIRIGGPTMYLNTPRAPTALVPTNNDYVKDFASRCKAAGLPSDFISIHMYPDDVTCAGQSADGTPHNYGENNQLGWHCHSCIGTFDLSKQNLGYAKNSGKSAD